MPMCRHAPGGVPRIQRVRGAEAGECARQMASAMVGCAVIVAVLRAELRLPEAFTLKDKRSVVKSLVQRTAQRFRASAAEVGLQNDVRRALVGVAVVSTSAAHADSVLRSALGFMEGTYPVDVVSGEVEHR